MIKLKLALLVILTIAVISISFWFAPIGTSLTLAVFAAYKFIVFALGKNIEVLGKTED